VRNGPFISLRNPSLGLRHFPGSNIVHLKERSKVCDNSTTSYTAAIDLSQSSPKAAASFFPRAGSSASSDKRAKKLKHLQPALQFSASALSKSIIEFCLFAMRSQIDDTMFYGIQAHAFCETGLVARKEFLQQCRHRMNDNGR
jgi:hypothetical protein